MSGEENSQNSQGGENTQNTVDTSKVFSNGYNEGLSKAEQRVAKRFSELTGSEVSSVDDVFDWVKTSSSKLAESISDPTQTEEYKNLQNTVNDYKAKLEEATNMATSIQNRYKFDSTWNSTESEFLKGAEYTIPQNDVKTLFNAQYEVEYKDGKEIVKKGDMPVMNESGEYKPVSQVIKDFAKGYLKTTAQGTGGGSGDGSGALPKYSDFKKAVDSGDDAKAQSLLQQFAEAGEKWAD